MEDLLGYSAGQVLGKPCWEVLCGRDVFGNTFCNEFCNLRRALSCNEPIHSFELKVLRASGETVRVLGSTLVVRDGEGSQHVTIHLLRSVPYDRDTGDEHAEPGDCEDRTDPVTLISPAGTDGCAKLTARQIEVLRCFAEGLSGEAVAEILHISVLTVRTHTRNILRNYAVHNLRQAVYVARRDGVI